MILNIYHIYCILSASSDPLTTRLIFGILKQKGGITVKKKAQLQTAAIVVYAVVATLFFAFFFTCPFVKIRMSTTPTEPTRLFPLPPDMQSPQSSPG